MLGIFRQSHTTGMRNNGNVEFFRHQQNGEDFVDASHAAGVNLADVNGARGEKLLEDDTILAHLAGGDADVVWPESIADGLVAQDVVGGGGLFDEPGLKFFEVLHILNCFGDRPDLQLLASC